MYSKFIGFFLCSFLISINVYATEQIRDRIVYEGTRYMLFFEPLEEYFSIYPEKKPKVNIVSSALWRGYVATFEIINNELYLKDIEIPIYAENAENSRKIEYVSVFQDFLDGQQYFKLDWFSGVLVIPYGELLKIGHMGYSSIYENYLFLEIDSGILISENRKNYIELNLLEELDKEKTDDVFSFLKEGNKIIIFVIILFLSGIIIFVIYKKKRRSKL